MTQFIKDESDPARAQGSAYYEDSRRPGTALRDHSQPMTL